MDEPIAAATLRFRALCPFGVKRAVVGISHLGNCICVAAFKNSGYGQLDVVIA